MKALILCDLQPDLLGSLKSDNKSHLLRALSVVVESARKKDWLIVYSGLKFSKGYEGVSHDHKMYGALARLNDKLGDDKVHWFMEGYEGSEILSSESSLAPRSEDKIVWRSQFVPHEVVDVLVAESVSEAVVVGAKASGAIQITCQLLMDKGMDVECIKECISDDDSDRLRAMVDHLLPIYSTLITLEEFMNREGIDSFSKEARQILLDTSYNNSLNDSGGGKRMLLAADCGRPGHGSRYIELLRERGNWKTVRTQLWYEDFVKGTFMCPIGKAIVHFCDEPEFSRVAMYLKGRENLDDKTKVIDIAGGYMPKTFCIENGHWVVRDDEVPPSDDDPGALEAPWFIKESDKNLGGSAISIVSKPSDILSVVKKNRKYVAQQHILDPLLCNGRKVHIKFYVLLMCEEDGTTWRLYTYKGSLLSISPNQWSPTDLSHDTQVTIHRWPEAPSETEGWKQHWNKMYEKCKKGTTDIIERAISLGKLMGRRNKKQFEVFSCDWMADTSFNIHFFEFNMSPAVSQKEFDDPEARDARRDYLMNHDEAMLREALAIAIPLEGGQKGDSDGQWDFVKEKIEGRVE